MSGLFMRLTWPLAIMPSADRVPVKARVGCPNHRINQFCVTCCLPSPAILSRQQRRSRHRRRMPSRKRDWFLTTLPLDHQRPSHPGKLVGQRNGRDLCRPPIEQRCQPGPVPGAVLQRIFDDGQDTGTEKYRRYRSPALVILPSLSRSPLEFCFGTKPIHAEKSRPERMAFGSATLATNAVASAGPTPGMASRRLQNGCVPDGNLISYLIQPPLMGLHFGPIAPFRWRSTCLKEPVTGGPRPAITGTSTGR